MLSLCILLASRSAHLRLTSGSGSGPVLTRRIRTARSHQAGPHPEIRWSFPYAAAHPCRDLRRGRLGDRSRSRAHPPHPHRGAGSARGLPGERPARVDHAAHHRHPRLDRVAPRCIGRQRGRFGGRRREHPARRHGPAVRGAAERWREPVRQQRHHPARRGRAVRGGERGRVVVGVLRRGEPGAEPARCRCDGHAVHARRSGGEQQRADPGRLGHRRRSASTPASARSPRRPRRTSAATRAGSTTCRRWT